MTYILIELNKEAAELLAEETLCYKLDDEEPDTVSGAVAAILCQAIEEPSLSKGMHVIYVSEDRMNQVTVI